jgi:hypothetical protein
MVDSPGFDPYVVLGVGTDADEIVIQLAYRARIREAHPDLAGAAGLEQAKRLNVARDWLLDPERRARLAPSPARPSPERRRPQRGSSRQRAATAGLAGREDELRTFLHAIERLTPDERARVNYSLGDAPPADLAVYLDYLDPGLWRQSRSLRSTVERTWARGRDEEAPIVPRLGRLLPSGFLVANAYAQWLLLGQVFESALAGMSVHGVPAAESLAARCTRPWTASVGQPRYGPRQHEVLAFFAVAQALPTDAAQRLARSWRHHLGRDGRGHPSEHIGPGVWLPSPPNVPDVLRISGHLAAVDASRIAPPADLAERDHAGFRFGLRLTADVIALGLGGGTGRDLLRPWHDALGPDPALRAAVGLGSRAG